MGDQDHNKLIAEVRRALGDYVKSEGCGCCQNTEAHKEAAERLGKLLKVKRFTDGSGRDFYRYATDNILTVRKHGKFK